MPRSNLSLFIYVGVVIGVSIGFDSTLHMEVSPESFSNMMTDELDLTCITNDVPSIWLKKIVMLEIMKMGEKPMVILSSDGVFEGPKWKENFEAKGTVNNNSRITYLQLTIKKPNVDDTGTYSCLMYYLDEALKMQELKSEANVTVINEDITVVLKYLLEKISTLEKNDQDQKKLILDQTSTLQEQEILLNEYQKHTQDQVNQLKENVYNHDRTLTAQDITLKRQDRSLQEQDKTLKEQNNTLNNIVNAMEEQNNSFKEQDVTLKEHERSLKKHDLIEKEQAITVKNQGENLRSQERVLKEQRDWYIVHKREMEAQIKRLVSKQVQLQNENVKALEDIGHIQNLTNIFQDCMMEVSSRFDLLEDRENNQSRSFKESIEKVKKAIENIKTQDNKGISPIAFSYGYTFNKYQKVVNGQVMKFTDQITNFGNRYNPRTGLFTSPRNGLYVFHLVLRTNNNKEWIDVSLVHNSVHLVRLYTLQTWHFDQPSVSTVVYLKYGDIVKPLVNGASNGYVGAGSRFSVFTGFLLKPW